MADREPSLELPVGGARIRDAVEADVSQMLELLFRAFQRWPALETQVPPVEHLRWKMQCEPITARRGLVAEVDGRIVAMMLRIVRRVRVKGRDCLARDTVDAAVDPLYQGRGLYNAILDYSREGPQEAELGLDVWYSTNPRTRSRSRPQKAKSLGNPIQVLRKPCRPRAIIARNREQYGGRLPAPLAILGIKLESVFNRVGHPPYWRRLRRDWLIRTLERFDDRIEGFFDEASRPFEFAVVKTKDYLNWRYFDPTSGRFAVRAAEEQGRLLGYLVLKVTEGEGYIADLLALPGRTDVVRSLIEDALRIFREAGVERVTCWVISRHPYNGILRRYGFIDSRKDVGFRYQPLSLEDEDLEFLNDPSTRVHLTHGDTDWI